MSDHKILFVSQAITPYLPADEISTLGKTLPQEMQSKGFEVRTFMPKFGQINERRNQLHEVIRLSGLNIEINENDHPLLLKVASLQPVRIQVYFIDNDDYFQKLATDIDPFGSNRPDNDERVIYFARGTVETVKKLRWEPTVIQCSGWISALVPLYMKKISDTEGVWPNAKTIYIVEPHNPEMAPIDKEILRKMREDGVNFANEELIATESFDVNTLHKMAIANADGVIFLTETPDENLLAMVKERGIPYALKEEMAEGTPAFLAFYDKL